MRKPFFQFDFIHTHIFSSFFPFFRLNDGNKGIGWCLQICLAKTGSILFASVFLFLPNLKGQSENEVCFQTCWYACNETSNKIFILVNESFFLFVCCFPYELSVVRGAVNALIASSKRSSRGFASFASSANVRYVLFYFSSLSSILRVPPCLVHLHFLDQPLVLYMLSIVVSYNLFIKILSSKTFLTN